MIDVSGATGAAAGGVSLAAGGSLSLGSTLKGVAGSGAGGGSFALDAGSLESGAGSTAGLDELAASLTTGGFNGAVDVRVRTGDLLLGAGNAVSAQSVTLTADTGAVTIGGTITADPGPQQGTLSIFGGTGVELQAGASLHADGTGAAGRGGVIELGAGELVDNAAGVLGAYNGAAISLDAGSAITASGAAEGGTLLLRAPAQLTTGDVGIQRLASSLTGFGEVTIEPVLPFNTAGFSSATTPTAADFQSVQQTVSAYMAQAASVIPGRLMPAGGVPLVIEPGVEIVAPGNLVLQSADGVSPALDLSPSGSNWRFNNAPVDLTIRAAGNITVANSITDGFADATVGNSIEPTLLTGPSSSIRLVAGADLDSANPLQTIAGAAGTLLLGVGATPAVVRTGTGTVDLIAAQDIVIGNAGSGAYTAGTPAIAPGGDASNPYPNINPVFGSGQTIGVLVPSPNDLLMSFPTGGGNLVVRAGQNIVGAPLTTPGVPAWQLREGGSGGALPTWGVNLAAYDWNFGTLGGGDLTISAGGSIGNVTAAAADSLLPQYGGGTAYVRSGGLSMSASGDIGSVQVYLADGLGTVTAGGALTAILPSPSAGDPNVGSAFYLGSSTIDVNARTGIDLGGVYNPSALVQPQKLIALAGSYFSYSEDSALNLESVGGEIDLGAASAESQALLGSAIQRVNGATATNGVGIFPASLSVAALGGDIIFGPGFGSGGSATLYPSARGNLDLLAAGNIDATADNAFTLLMSDAPAGSYPTVASPIGQTQVNSTADAFGGDNHIGDPNPALVTAGANIEGLSLSIPKAGQVVAGANIQDLTYLGQNLSATDESVLMAGNDIAYSTSYEGQGVTVGGPGALEVIAGRNVALGFSSGITTTGNLGNPNLPTAQGADVTVVTGLAAAPGGSSASEESFAQFFAKIIEPSPAYQAALVSYMEALGGTPTLSLAASEAAFEALPVERQRPFIDQVFFNELSLSGIASNTTPGAGFAEGYRAIDTLFPGSRTASTGAVSGSYAGDLTLQFSQISTLSGGNIDLIVPGGSIDVGLANPPAILPDNVPPRSSASLPRAPATWTSIRRAT